MTLNTNTIIPNKAVIYCRVSSARQEEEGHGLASQETRCRQHAAQKGYEVVAVFPDTISGGGDFMKRPGMVSLLAFLDAQPDENFVVVFDDLKRFARDTRFHLDLRQAFRKRGAVIECLNFKFEDTPEGEFIETIMAAQGALERKQNGRQVSQKMKARLDTGYWAMRNPVGYRYESKKGHGKILIKNEPVASIITEMLEGYAIGRFETPTEAARFLERSPDFPKSPNGSVRIEQVSQMLDNAIYAGFLNFEPWGVKDVEGKHEPLISLETFELIQHRRHQKARLPARKNIGNEFALRGFACCAGCGVPLRSSLSKGRNKYYAYYLCQTKSCEDYGKSIARDTIEGDVGDIIKSLQPTQNLIALTKIMFRKAWDMRYAQIGSAKETLKKHIVQVDRQIEKLMDRLMSAESDNIIRRYEEKIDGFERDKTRYQQQIAKIQDEKRPTYEEQLEPALKFITNPWKLWVSGDITLRRLVLKMAFADHLKYDRKTGARTANLSMPFKALEAVQGMGLGNGGA